MIVMITCTSSNCMLVIKILIKGGFSQIAHWIIKLIWNSTQRGCLYNTWIINSMIKSFHILINETLLCFHKIIYNFMKPNKTFTVLQNSIFFFTKIIFWYITDQLMKKSWKYSVISFLNKYVGKGTKGTKISTKNIRQVKTVTIKHHVTSSLAVMYLLLIMASVNTVTRGILPSLWQKAFDESPSK